MFREENRLKTKTHSFSFALPDLPFYTLQWWRCPHLTQVTLFSTKSLLMQVRAEDSHNPMVQRKASYSSNICISLLVKRNIHTLLIFSNLHGLALILQDLLHCYVADLFFVRDSSEIYTIWKEKAIFIKHFVLD